MIWGLVLLGVGGKGEPGLREVNASTGREMQEREGENPKRGFPPLEDYRSFSDHKLQLS